MNNTTHRGRPRADPERGSVHIAGYADYKRRIAEIRWLMKETKPNESTEYIEKLARGIDIELDDETRLPEKKRRALSRRLWKVAPDFYEHTKDVDPADHWKYGYDDIVAMYVASGMSMRKIAFELEIDVSTVSRHVRKWAEENAEQRGGVATAREVELARLDEMLAKENARKGGGDLKNKLQILDRKYRLLGLSSSSPKVVVGIGVQQAQPPRVIEGVAHDITEDTDGISQIPD